MFKKIKYDNNKNNLFNFSEPPCSVIAHFTTTEALLYILTEMLLFVSFFLLNIVPYIN